MEIFETYLNDFLYDLKSETLNSLLEETMNIMIFMMK